MSDNPGPTKYFIKLERILRDAMDGKRLDEPEWKTRLRRELQQEDQRRQRLKMERIAERFRAALDSVSQIAWQTEQRVRGGKIRAQQLKEESAKLYSSIRKEYQRLRLGGVPDENARRRIAKTYASRKTVNRALKEFSRKTPTTGQQLAVVRNADVNLSS